MSAVFGSSTALQVKPEAGWKPILEQATVEVFQLMAAVHLVPQPSSTEATSGAITAMVGMAGALCGMMNIRCSQSSAQKLATRMLSGSSAPTPHTVRDALGELCNMIAGNFKAKIANLADSCMLSVPTVISGDDYSLDPADPYHLIQLHFDFEGQPLFVSLVVHQ
jgi:chemotaxis protein CheX